MPALFVECSLKCVICSFPMHIYNSALPSTIHTIDFPCASREATSPMLSSDSLRTSSASESRTIHLCNDRTGYNTAILEAMGTEFILYRARRATRHMLASASDDRPHGFLMADLVTTPPGHRYPVRMCSLAFSVDRVNLKAPSVQHGSTTGRKN